MTRTKYFQVLIFFAIAFALTFLFNRYLPELKISGIDIKTIITGLGPLLGGLFCYQFFGTNNTYRISFSGVRPVITYGVIGLAIFLPLLLITRVSKERIVFSIITQFAYSFGEEFGWRHYLQNITSEMNKWTRPFFIGILWFFWHYSFGTSPVKLITGQNIPAFIGFPVIILILSLFSFLWGDLTIKTKSVLMPTVAHSITKYGDRVSVAIVVTTLLLLQIFWNKLKPGQTKTA